MRLLELGFLQVVLVLRVTNKTNGEGGIRTHDEPKPILVFETSSFSRSDTSPEVAGRLGDRASNLRRFSARVNWIYRVTGALAVRKMQGKVGWPRDEDQLALHLWPFFADSPVLLLR